MSCAESPKLYSSLTLSCEEKFSSSYTAEVTTTSVFVDYDPTGKATVTFTPHFDAINGFGLEYVQVKTPEMTILTSLDNLNMEIVLQITSTRSSSTPAETGMTTTTRATSLPSSRSSTSAQAINETHSASSWSHLSGGAIAGIVVSAVAFLAIIILVWNRSKIAVWLHQKTAPRSNQMQQLHSTTFQSQPSLGSYHDGYASAYKLWSMELDSTREPAELAAAPPIAEKDLKR